MKGKIEILEKGKWGGVRITLSKEVVYQNYVKSEHMKMIGKGIPGGKKQCAELPRVTNSNKFCFKIQCEFHLYYKTKIFQWQQFSCIFGGRAFAENISVLISL